MKNERIYTVQEAFELLERYKITTNIESVRRWLRSGTIEGIKPTSRKEGWTVTQTALERFITSRMPDDFNTTNVVNGSVPCTFLDEETVRADERTAMWYEITRKNIWEGYVEIKKSTLRDAAEHRGYSQKLLDEVWERCVANSSAYKKPRVSYLLDAFSFEGKRLPLSTDFANKEDQVVFAIWEYVRCSR